MCWWDYYLLYGFARTDPTREEGLYSWLDPARRYLGKFYYATKTPVYHLWTHEVSNLVGLYNTLSMMCTCHATSSVCIWLTLHPPHCARTKNLGRETSQHFTRGITRGIPLSHPYMYTNYVSCSCVLPKSRSPTSWKSTNYIKLLQHAADATVSLGKHQGNSCFIYSSNLVCVGGKDCQ